MTDEDDQNSDRNDLPVFPSRGQQCTSDSEPPSHAVVKAVADESDTGLIDLPPLNDVVDTEALNTLVRVNHRHDEAWLRIRFSYAGYTITITENSDISLSRQEGANPAIVDIKPDWPHVTPVSEGINSRSTSNLAAGVVSAVADHSGHDPAHVRQAIDDILDRSALARLNSKRADRIARAGATVQFSTLGYDVLIEPDETIAIGSALQRLQLTGANVLLVGAVPDSVMDLASSNLLGERDRDRQRLFALLDRHINSAIDRLSRINDTTETARAINYASTARSAVPESQSITDPQPNTDTDSYTFPDTNTDTPSENRSVPPVGPDHHSARNSEDTPEITVKTVDENIEAFVTTIEATVEMIQEQQLEPTELRFCFDSLRPLLEEHGVKRTRSILEPICEQVTSASGIGHYIFPVEYESEYVQALKPLFEATIEIRINEVEPMQRWHLHRSDYTTEWFTLRID
ncbi:HalOD1 output domain-containing protein [Natrialba sp. PRR66]|uniref:DUF7504 family protein n=1 Tax=Natrialba sp. PRR66 TaxID=3098146 RepID=UPI002B1E3C22|nr:HalOD1 output domain-containing protein [Natrialba sp. PRR66]